MNKILYENKNFRIKKLSNTEIEINTLDYNNKINGSVQLSKKELCAIWNAVKLDEFDNE